MSKPIGHYVDTNIPVVGDIEREYGSNLEGMSERDKLFLVNDISGDLLYNIIGSEPESKTREFACRLRDEITEYTDAISLLKAIINNL